MSKARFKIGDWVRDTRNQKVGIVIGIREQVDSFWYDLDGFEGTWSGLEREDKLARAPRPSSIPNEAIVRRMDEMELGGILNVLYGLIPDVWSASSGWIRVTCASEDEAARMRHYASKAIEHLNGMIAMTTKSLNPQQDQS